MFETWYKMAAMLQSGLDISGIITHALPAASSTRRFEIIGGGECGKVILDWAAPRLVPSLPHTPSRVASPSARPWSVSPHLGVLQTLHTSGAERSRPLGAPKHSTPAL